MSLCSMVTGKMYRLSHSVIGMQLKFPILKILMLVVRDLFLLSHFSMYKDILYITLKLNIIIGAI